VSDQKAGAGPHTEATRDQGQLVIETGLAVLASDIRGDAAFKGAESIHRFRIRSVLAVPLGPRPVRGVLYLDTQAAERAFSAEDRSATILGGKIASRLSRETRRSLRGNSPCVALSPRREPKRSMKPSDPSMTPRRAAHGEMAPTPSRRSPGSGSASRRTRRC
jgi:hypothetical protein